MSDWLVNIFPQVGFMLPITRESKSNRDIIITLRVTFSKIDQPANIAPIVLVFYHYFIAISCK